MQKGIMGKFILLLSIMVTSVSASELEICTEAEKSFVRNKLEISKNSKSYMPFELEQNYKGICKIHNPKMMDGLSYLLYKDTNSNAYFISLYNGLDGSYKMHGPFNK